MSHKNIVSQNHGVNGDMGGESSRSSQQTIQKILNDLKSQNSNVNIPTVIGDKKIVSDHNEVINSVEPKFFEFQKKTNQDISGNNTYDNLSNLPQNPLDRKKKPMLKNISIRRKTNGSIDNQGTDAFRIDDKDFEEKTSRHTIRNVLRAQAYKEPKDSSVRQIDRHQSPEKSIDKVIGKWMQNNSYSGFDQELPKLKETKNSQREFLHKKTSSIVLVKANTNYKAGELSSRNYRSRTHQELPERRQTTRKDSRVRLPKLNQDYDDEDDEAITIYGNNIYKNSPKSSTPLTPLTTKTFPPNKNEIQPLVDRTFNLKNSDQSCDKFSIISKKRSFWKDVFNAVFLCSMCCTDTSSFGGRSKANDETKTISGLNRGFNNGCGYDKVESKFEN